MPFTEVVGGQTAKFDQVMLVSLHGYAIGCFTASYLNLLFSARGHFSGLFRAAFVRLRKIVSIGLLVFTLLPLATLLLGLAAFPLAGVTL